MAAQKKFFINVSAIMVFLMFIQENVYFSLMYGMMMASMFTISTFSYDEFENGAPYLFTMPVSRKGYVREKYVFGLLATLVSGVLFSALGAAITWIRALPGDWLTFGVTASVYLCTVWMILAVVIPLQIKFGAENSRVAFLVVFGILALGLYLISKIQGKEMLLIKLQKILEAAGAGGIFVIGIAAAAVILVVSMRISERLMEKKEF